ncbi:MAG: hypothetical protein HOP96_02260 [Sphingomonas sp.]|nr:hypothetical protein [Sphingomonas sp.]
MQMLRPAIAIDPRLFGRRMPGFILGTAEQPGGTIGEDLKLFATTFAIGFLFVSVLIF